MKSSQEAIQRPSRTTKVSETGVDKRTTNTAGKSPAAPMKRNAVTKARH